MEVKDLTELLDVFEKVFINQAKDILKQSDIEANEEIARAIVGQVGVRISFGDVIGKDELDKTLYEDKINKINKRKDA